MSPFPIGRFVIIYDTNVEKNVLVTNEIEIWTLNSSVDGVKIIDLIDAKGTFDRKNVTNDPKIYKYWPIKSIIRNLKPSINEHSSFAHCAKLQDTIEAKLTINFNKYYIVKEIIIQLPEPYNMGNYLCSITNNYNPNDSRKYNS